MHLVAAPLAFARRCADGESDPVAAWRACALPERMVLALDVLADERWLLRAAVLAWRAALGAVAPPEPLAAALATLTARSLGGAGAAAGLAFDARLAVAVAPEFRAMAFGLRALASVVADAPARSLPAVASVEMAVETALELGTLPGCDRDAVRARLADAVRNELDPLAALREERRFFEVPAPDEELELPF